MNRYLYLLVIFVGIVVVGCEKKDSYDTAVSSKASLQEEQWLFERQYIRNINDSSWEKVSLSALNNYVDFKIDFTFIYTGKSQNCGLYAKGMLVDEAQEKNKKQKKFLLRPNLIPQTVILLTRQDNSRGNSPNNYTVNIEISNIAEFIRICGDAHQYAAGEYNLQ
ncbi:hypothetical protein CQA66_05480 [Helicobacter aurati]|uniref:Lipoprotein n=1 Tax=Helicobacter aurati TaxID=137778 RepID=A0A3D8J352_9HELI|nr:hypothetical protein [Helicobacter aurati]RDU71918.1 hypothetical protein CQA66_05480 [Helicobacter aurati]